MFTMKSGNLSYVVSLFLASRFKFVHIKKYNSYIIWQSFEDIIGFELKIIIFCCLPTVVWFIYQVFHELFYLCSCRLTFYCFFGIFFRKLSYLKSLKQRIYLLRIERIFIFHKSSSLHYSNLVKCWTIRDSYFLNPSD